MLGREARHRIPLAVAITKKPSEVWGGGKMRLEEDRIERILETEILITLVIDQRSDKL